MTSVAGEAAWGNVRVWFVDLSVDDKELPGLWQTLDAEEQARAARFAMPHLTRRFIASHGALRALLATHLNIGPGSVRFQYGDKGKPSLTDNFASSRIRFSLSHSGDSAVIAIAHGCEAGVDVEEVHRKLDFEPLLTQVFTPAEYAWIMSRPPELRPESFYICWTAKEAYLKARGDGLSFSLQAFEVLPEPTSNRLQLTVHRDAVESNRWTLHRLVLPSGCVGALAVEAKYRHQFFTSDREQFRAASNTAKEINPEPANQTCGSTPWRIDSSPDVNNGS